MWNIFTLRHVCQNCMDNLTCPAFLIKVYAYLRNPTLELRESQSQTTRSKLCQGISYGKRKSTEDNKLSRPK